MIMFVDYYHGSKNQLVNQLTQSMAHLSIPSNTIYLGKL